MTAKFQYGQSIIRRNICTEDDNRHNWEQIANLLELLGLPAIPSTKTDADGLPSADPPRAKVRFQLSSTFNGSNIATANIVDPGGTALSPGQSINVYDGVGRYTGAVAGNEYGYAQQFEQADGSLAWEPISLGGLTSAGSSADIHAKVNSSDTTSDYLINKVYNNNGSPPAFGAGYQEVFAEALDIGSSEYQMRLYTSSNSAAETFTVLVDSTDSTASYLWTSMTDATGTAYNANDHARVYFSKVGGAATNQTMRGYIAYDELDGRVRVDDTDTLEHLEDKFASGAYDSDLHDQVYFENIAGGGGTKNLRAYVDEPRVACDSGDLAEFLPDQFTGLTATAFDEEDHIPVKFATRNVGGDIDLDAYIEKADVEIPGMEDVVIKSFDSCGLQIIGDAESGYVLELKIYYKEYTVKGTEGSTDNSTCDLDLDPCE